MEQGPPARESRHSHQAGARGEPVSAPTSRGSAGTLRALIRAAGMSVDEFVALV